MLPFAFDTETGLIQENLKAPPLVCVSYATPLVLEANKASKIDVGLLHHRDAKKHLQAWFSDPDRVLIGANIAYDMGVVMQRYPDLCPAIWQAYADNRVEDVAIRQKLIDIADGTYWALRKKKGSYSLAGLVKRHLDVDLAKGEDTWRLRYMELHGVPLDKWPVEAVRYAKDDAEATLHVYLAQQASEAYLEDSFRQARAAWWIHLMAAWGICTDQQAVAKLAKEIQAEYDELENRLREEKLIKETGKKVVKLTRDTKAAKALMTQTMQNLGKEVPLTNKGQVALDKDACKDSENDSLISYADLTHYKTLLSKDIPALSKPEIHSYFEVLLETGRTSSSNPNIQNPARKGGVRECLVPRPGCVFVDADYDIIELRTFAQVCLWTVEKSKLAEALNAHYDPHLSLGAQLLKIPYEEAVKRKKDKEVKEARQMAKCANFGFPGGMGATKFRDFAKAGYGVLLTEEESVALRETWFENWPEAREYFRWVSDRKQNEWYFDESRGEDSCRVKQFVSNRYRGGCSYTEACNTRFQGLAADIAKYAGFLISRECYDESLGSVLFGSRIVNMIHDQFIVECFEEVGHEAAARVGELMVEAAKPFVPDVPATCTPCLARCFSKDAEAVYDASGRLVPWTPKAS